MPVYEALVERLPAMSFPVASLLRCYAFQQNWAAVDRLLALGATEVHWDKRPQDADYVILADPEGNRFCVVDISR